MRTARIARERADAHVATGSGSIDERGAERIAHGGDDRYPLTVKALHECRADLSGRAGYSYLHCHWRDLAA